jgi:hypothetical protein
MQELEAGLDEDIESFSRDDIESFSRLGAFLFLFLFFLSFAYS